MRLLKKFIYRLLDFLVSPILVPIAIYLKKLRSNYFNDSPFTKKILLKIGVYPIHNHYYEPFFNYMKLKNTKRSNNDLIGVDFNDEEQLDLLNKFNYNEELKQIPYSLSEKRNELDFCFTEGPFRSGDAEYLYNFIRYFKPKRIIEIGSGYSTLLARKAILMNNKENSNYSCEHLCIEPFENKFLEKLNINVIREKVEDIDLSFFDKLVENDILFIDSSHIIRPQGDVLYEYLKLLPSLNNGVLVHIHDVFTPNDYPRIWLKEMKLWNEQYLLEAFLIFNNRFKIIGATNYLLHKHQGLFLSKCPIMQLERANGIEREPGSFWIYKN